MITTITVMVIIVAATVILILMTIIDTTITIMITPCIHPRPHVEEAGSPSRWVLKFLKFVR